MGWGRGHGRRENCREVKDTGGPGQSLWWGVAGAGLCQETVMNRLGHSRGVPKCSWVCVWRGVRNHYHSGEARRGTTLPCAKAGKCLGRLDYQ